MSKGISTQQQRILGAAVAISRLRNGQPLARTPQRHDGYRVPVVTGVWPDISAYIASHLVAGVGLRRKDRYSSRLETTPAALAARSSISRAITSLEKRGLLAYRPYRSASGDYEQFGRTYGYVLTATGLAAGLPHDLTVPNLALRLWLMDDDYRKAWWKERPPISKAYQKIGIDEGCQAPPFLPAPGCDMPNAETLKQGVAARLAQMLKESLRTPGPIIAASPIHVDLVALAARLRALAIQNDPDVVRAGLDEIASNLEKVEMPLAKPRFG
jgi:hypothetical protein